MSPESDTGPAARIAAALRADITEGRYAPGAKLPPVRDLAEQYGVSRNTAAKAIAQLRNEGHIITRYGSGAYVRESHPIRRMDETRKARSKWQNTIVPAYNEDHSEVVEQQGTQEQTVEVVPADEEVASALDVEIGTQVVERSRIVFRGGVATHTVTSYYRLEDVEGTAIMDDRPGMAGSGGSFAILAERGMEPYEIDELLKSRLPTVDEVQTLQLPPGETVMDLTQWTRTAEGRVVEFARAVHAGSRFEWFYKTIIPD